jgi:hypothetical protein
MPTSSMTAKVEACVSANHSEISTKLQGVSFHGTAVFDCHYSEKFWTRAGCQWVTKNPVMMSCIFQIC